MVAASEGEELNTADDCVLQGRLNNSETLLVYGFNYLQGIDSILKSCTTQLELKCRNIFV